MLVQFVPFKLIIEPEFVSELKSMNIRQAQNRFSPKEQVTEASCLIPCMEENCIENECCSGANEIDWDKSASNTNFLSWMKQKKDPDTSLCQIVSAQKE